MLSALCTIVGILASTVFVTCAILFLVVLGVPGWLAVPVGIVALTGLMAGAGWLAAYPRR